MIQYGQTPQINRSGQTPGYKKLFHSVRDIALILDKTLKPGYGVLKIGTILAVNSADSKLVPYPEAAANANNTNAKAYLVADPSDADTDIYVGIEDSYKFAVGDSLIIDGTDSGTAEVQSMSEATIAENDVYTLSYGGETLTSTAMDSNPTTAELVAALTGGANAATYAAMPFTLSAGSSAVTITWKAVGVVADLCTAEKTTGSGSPEVTQTTAGAAVDPTATAAENLGAITAIDVTAKNSTQAKVTVSTGVTTAANFTSAKFGNVYVKGGDDSTPFTKAEYVLDIDIDTGTGVNAKGANTSVVINNAVLYTASLVGLDAAAITDLGVVSDGRFTILK